MSDLDKYNFRAAFVAFADFSPGRLPSSELVDLFLKHRSENYATKRGNF